MAPEKRKLERSSGNQLKGAPVEVRRTFSQDPIPILDKE